MIYCESFIVCDRCLQRGPAIAGVPSELESLIDLAKQKGWTMPYAGESTVFRFIKNSISYQGKHYCPVCAETLQK